MKTRTIKIALRLTGVLLVTVLLLIIIFTLGVGIWTASLGMNLLSLIIIIAGIVALLIAILLWYSYLENQKYELINMKDIIKKWLGIDAHSEILTRLLEEKEKEQAKVEQEKIRKVEAEEWERLKTEIEEADKSEGGFLHLLVTSPSFYDKVAKYIELSNKLKNNEQMEATK